MNRLDMRVEVVKAEGRVDQFIDCVKAKIALDKIKLVRKTLFKAIAVRERDQSSI